VKPWFVAWGDDREVLFVYRDKPDGSLHFTRASTPYVARLLAVAVIVLEYGGDEVLRIGAFLPIWACDQSSWLAAGRKANCASDRLRR
jgi:hypothetical protein